MNRVSVSSAVMRSVGYDAGTRVLEVVFNNGSVYEYLDVPGEHFDALLSSASKGHFFNSRVRPAFRFVRVV